MNIVLNKKTIVMFFIVALSAVFVSAQLGFDSENFPVLRVPEVSSFSNGSSGVGNVTSVSSSTNCILVDPTSGDVILTFNESCGDSGIPGTNGTGFYVNATADGDCFNYTGYTIDDGVYTFNWTTQVCDGETGPEGPQGPQGIPGTNGTDGINGTNGIDGTNGTNGINGTDGINGTNGIDGLNGSGFYINYTEVGDCFNYTGYTIEDEIYSLNWSTLVCDGEQGPQGIPGINGTDGIDGINGTFEGILNATQFENVSTTWSINITWLTNFVNILIGDIDFTNIAFTNESNNFTEQQIFSGGAEIAIGENLSLVGNGVASSIYFVDTSGAVLGQMEFDSTGFFPTSGLLLRSSQDVSIIPTGTFNINSDVTFPDGKQYGFGSAPAGDSDFYLSYNATSKNLEFVGRKGVGIESNSFIFNPDMVDVDVTINGDDGLLIHFDANDHTITSNASINVSSGKDVCITGGNCLSSASGNSSWNQSYADTLYYSINNPENFINVTTGQVFNDTALIITVNSSLWTYINNNEDAWNSTYNVTYDELLGQVCPAGFVVNGTLSNGTFICTLASSDSSKWTNTSTGLTPATGYNRRIRVDRIGINNGTVPDTSYIYGNIVASTPASNARVFDVTFRENGSGVSGLSALYFLGISNNTNSFHFNENRLEARLQNAVGNQFINGLFGLANTASGFNFSSSGVKSIVGVNGFATALDAEVTANAGTYLFVSIFGQAPDPLPVSGAATETSAAGLFAGDVVVTTGNKLYLEGTSSTILDQLFTFTKGDTFLYSDGTNIYYNASSSGRHIFNKNLTAPGYQTSTFVWNPDVYGSPLNATVNPYDMLADDGSVKHSGFGDFIYSLQEQENESTCRWVLEETDIPGYKIYSDGKDIMVIEEGNMTKPPAEFKQQKVKENKRICDTMLVPTVDLGKIVGKTDAGLYETKLYLEDLQQTVSEQNKIIKSLRDEICILNPAARICGEVIPNVNSTLSYDIVKKTNSTSGEIGDILPPINNQ